jgi:L,D-transpeptidase ErfK/SrfK
MVQASRFLRLTDPAMQGPDVLAVQRRLIALGDLQGVFDGVFGPQTRDAVIAFQRASGIRADGIVGPDTWMALGINQVEWGGGRHRIAVDTVRNLLVLYDSGRFTETFPVSTGKPTTPTPLGDWVIVEKMENPGGPFGARWMRLSIPNGGYAIHGTDDPSTIGQSVTHGCVRMRNEDVIQLYGIVPLGTLVSINGQVFTTRLLHRYVSPGPDIETLQQMLQRLGYYKGSITGSFDIVTENAVRAFQSTRGLAVDGIVGPQTAVAIQAQYDIALGDVEP